MRGIVLILCWGLLWRDGEAQYKGEEELDPLQKTATLDGAKRELDNIEGVMKTNRTTTTLNCASGFMNIVVNFNDPFFGIIYPNGSRTSSCLTHGDGRKEYTINLPLKGCGTLRVDRRVFMNNVMVRFHKGLELEGDEVKTIICRYPSPVVVLPPPPPPVSLFADPPIPPPLKKIGEVEILMIICAIMFLALLLVGMACSYTCLKKRNIRIIRRRPLSAATSEISKLSGSILFEGLKIPRAHATSTYESDTAIVSQSETLPSDYPSESPSSGSEVEEFDVQEVEDRLSSVYSDAYVQSEAEIFAAHTVIKPPKPTFMVRVKKAPTPPRTPEPDYSLQNALSQSLTTILERDESYRGESRPGSEHAIMLTESEDDYSPPPTLIPTPEYAQIHRKTQKVTAETHAPPRHMDIQHIENVTMTQKEFTDIQETIERGTKKTMVPREPSEPDSDYPSEARSVTDVVEELAMIQLPPQITTHEVDDIYHTTIRETHTTEDVEKHRRFTKQYHMKPKPAPLPKWNVAIRHYPGPKYADENESSGPEWEAYSEPGSDIFRAQMLEGIDDRLSEIEVERLEHPPPPNWRVLLRVLEPPQTDEAVREVLSIEDREKWRQIITTESTLRTMLTTASIREDFERIRRDQRYEKLFEPKKWDVIIRILSPPRDPNRGDETSSEAMSMSDTESLPSRDGKRYRKYEQPAATGGRKSSLPPVYEYDSDGYPIVKKSSGPQSTRSRRSSKSSMVSGLDVRSLAETEVNFTRALDTCSEASGPASSYGGARSHADRSHSEMTYSIPVLHDEDYPDTDFDDRLSARTADARSLARSASEFTEDWRHHDNMERCSQSSVDSKPHRMCERSESEYMEAAPHYSDFQTSPESSPQMKRRYEEFPRGTEPSHVVIYPGNSNQRSSAVASASSSSTVVQQHHQQEQKQGQQQHFSQSSSSTSQFIQEGSSTRVIQQQQQQQQFHSSETRTGFQSEKRSK